MTRQCENCPNLGKCQGWPREPRGQESPSRGKALELRLQSQGKQKGVEFTFIQQALGTQHRPGTAHVSPHVILTASLWGGQRKPDTDDSGLHCTVHYYTSQFLWRVLMCQLYSKYFACITPFIITTTLQGQYCRYPYFTNQ